MFPSKEIEVCPTKAAGPFEYVLLSFGWQFDKGIAAAVQIDYISTVPRNVHFSSILWRLILLGGNIVLCQDKNEFEFLDRCYHHRYLLRSIHGG